MESGREGKELGIFFGLVGERIFIIGDSPRAASACSCSWLYLRGTILVILFGVADLITKSSFLWRLECGSVDSIQGNEWAKWVVRARVVVSPSNTKPNRRESDDGRRR